MAGYNDKNNKELNALISMLDEPSSSMFSKIKNKIISYGLEAIPFLENTWDTCFDEIIQDRIESLIHKIQFNNTYKEFHDWVASRDHKLLDGYFLITKYLYPDLEKEEIVRSVNTIRNDVWLEMNDNLTALEKVRVINHIIYDLHKFKANRKSVQTIQNHFLNNLLETKKGSNLSLGILYLIIVQDLNIPVFGVDLPKHFILAYAADNNQIFRGISSEEDILFYINPFNKGTVITRSDVELFVKQLNISSKSSFYVPCDELTIIKRLLNDLIISYNYQGFPEKVKELELFLSLLSI